ncbi:hypothetical protein D5086_029095 [Populus alba]|uniref:Uncharacterized protein n=1 Tax=Populus alba TaxID=43335 RepID=A0ACC4ASN7_POPAL
MANQQDPPSHGINDLTKQAQVVVVMVPLPAQGHLNQLLQLSRLILSHNIPVHYVGATTHNRQAKQRVHGWDPNAAANIHFHDIEIPPFHCPLPNPKAKIKFPSHLQPVFNASSQLTKPVSMLLRALSCKARKVIVIHDSLMGSVIEEARFLSNAESYTFHSVSAFAISLYEREREGKVIEENVLFPRNTPSLEGCFTDEFADFVDCHYSKYQKFNTGRVYNTCKLVESAYLDFLEKDTIKEGIKHWALGPFNPVTIPESSKKQHFCLEWLDKQAKNTVIYVSFGTTTTFDDEQIKELAIGLRESKKKFIWVLRDGDKGDVFNGEERRTELPKGLMASTEGDEMRKRAAEMGESVRGSVAEGGVSRMEMESFIAHITRKNSIKYKYGHRKQSLCCASEKLRAKESVSLLINCNKEGYSSSWSHKRFRTNNLRGRKRVDKF